MSFRVLWSLGSTGSTLKTIIIGIVRGIVKSDLRMPGKCNWFHGAGIRKKKE